MRANSRFSPVAACSAHADDIERCAREGQMTANVMFSNFCEMRVLRTSPHGCLSEVSAPSFPGHVDVRSGWELHIFHHHLTN